jgi:hypothetical protein
VGWEYRALAGRATLDTCESVRWALADLAAWHACAACHHLIGGGDRSGLVERVVKAAVRLRELREEQHGTIRHDATLQVDEFSAAPRRARRCRPA